MAHYPYKVVIFFVCTFLWDRVTPSTIGEQKQVQYQKDAGNSVNGQSSSQETHLGEKVNDNQNSISENKNNHFVGANDNGRYSNVDVNKKIHDDNKFYSGKNFNQDSGENAQGVAQKKGHKKGHHNTGFRNSYHKDESSNNSSYFDDYNDEADQSNIHNDRGRYGNTAGKQYDTRREDGIQHVRDNVRQGNFDRRGETDNRNLDHRDYDRRQYQGDRRDNSQTQHGQNYANRDREFAQAERTPQYHGRPYYDRPLVYPPRPVTEYRRDYYDDRMPRFPLPIQHRDRQTITIYEDPRIDSYNKRDRMQQDGEFVHLDVRPGNQRFQRYDGVYEPGRNWGVNRRSDINPLVFNYNRY